MQLQIDSTQNTNLKLQLDENVKFIEHISPRDQDILFAINQFLNEQKVDLNQLTSIQVATGPGSFTSIRVGISVAQALSLALDIPINNLSAGSSIEPHYGSDPNITKSKKLFS